LPQAVLEQAKDGDVVIVMGAGSVGNAAQRVVDMGGVA
jgi:UDP-N-acetylmuramate--alanine ligase